ncbi:glutamate mutase L [Pseudonocardia sp. NPDC049154]|uniref:glutamate mutase L n=1 Tax=Pseudonocardia sp. NPDC049154 TaxID=3155501 RepID=UPI0033CDBF3B
MTGAAAPGGPGAPPGTGAVCLDVGSTWTKAVLVHPDGGLAGFAEHRTTTADVLEGVDAAVRGVTAAAAREPEPAVLACSSAGGGLRLAVVGTEKLISTEAGHRVARSAGSHVVHVHAGPLEPADVRVLRGHRPGALLLLGGADGDDPSVLLHNAGKLARARVRFPIVLAGNAEARDDALALLRATGRTVVACANVAPVPGELVPGPARAALAEVFAQHVLGGRAPAAAPRFRRMVRFMTPDAVRSGTAELARICGTRVLVVDVGCATTDVHSAGPGRRPRRTVEGDLGVRAAAEGVLLEAQAEEIVDPVEADLLTATVRGMTAEVGSVPRDPGSAAEDRRIAALAAVVAARRHLRDELAPEDGDPDDPHDAAGSGPVGLVVLSGGVFRQRDAAGIGAVVGTLQQDPMLAPLLASASVLVDADFALAPAGLLAAHDRCAAAEALLCDHLLGSR